MKPPQTDSGNNFGDAKRHQTMLAISQDAPGKLGLFKRVYSEKATPRMAIKAKCLECCWLDERAIRECSASECPCWSFRPYVTKG